MEQKHIAGRTLARSQALQIIFQAEATGRSVRDVLDGSYVLTGDPSDVVLPNADIEGDLVVLAGPIDPFGETLALGTDAMCVELDRILSHFSQRWDVNRMPSVDRNLMRMALYEMLEVEDVPVAVTIDESVELAKAYGTDESSKFINGVLGTVASAMAEGEDLVALYGQPSEDEESYDAPYGEPYEGAYEDGSYDEEYRGEDQSFDEAGE